MATATSDQQYYEDKNSWGEEQFVTLKDILDTILITADDDSYFKDSKRFRASIFGKLGIKRLNVDVKAQKKAITIQLPPTKIFPFPRYMMNWSRISVLNECKMLSPLLINNNSNIQDYLQDDNWELLYDEEGNVLRGSDFNAEVGHCKIKICRDIPERTCKDTKFDNSWVKEHRDESYFSFSDELVDELIVIEFTTTGLDSILDCDIKVHTHLEQALTYFIKWQLLEGKRNVPKSEVLYFKELFRIEKNRAKPLLGSKITIEQMLKAISLRY